MVWEANQWFLMDILTQWEAINEKDSLFITGALSIVQTNDSLALSCIQAQLWMQLMTAPVRRECEEGTLPVEIQKVFWDNIVQFENKSQSWWYLDNSTYDPICSTATVFVSPSHSTSVYRIYLVIALGLNHTLSSGAWSMGPKR